MEGITKATQQKVQELKELGNDCIRNRKYEEAIIHYSSAIDLDPKNYSLYSNRSLAFLKIQYYYYAVEDAKQSIRLKPDWAKGYFRKGEIESATLNYNDALLSYEMALSLQPNDINIKIAFERTYVKRNRELRVDEQIPWFGAGIGIIMGVLLVIGDNLLTAQPSVTNPVIMVVLTIIVAVNAFAAAKGFRLYTLAQRKALLKPRLENFSENDKTEDDDAGTGKAARNSNNNHRYTKAQARFRFKKGRKN